MSRRLRRLWDSLGGRDGGPELVRSQFAAFTTQLPVLYGILVVNMAALAVTHVAFAPLWLGAGVPAALGAVCLSRAFFWLRTSRADISAKQAAAKLRATLPLAATLAACFTAWAISMLPYGGPLEQCQVAFFIAITVIACIFCLMHLLRAAVVVTVIVVAPFVVVCCLSGQPVLTAIGLNFVLVTAGLVFILIRNYRDFADLVASQAEVRAQQAQAARLHMENLRLAEIDSLTGLPNRRCFLVGLDAALAAAERDGARFGIALLDLDGFKGVNDLYGHAAGDRLLAEVGARLAGASGPLVSVARLGGDEFGAILSGDPSDADIRAFGLRLRDLLGTPYLRSEIMIEVPVSAGLVAYPAGGETAQLLFERAEYALYYAKQTRGEGPVIFSQEHESLIREAARMEQALRHADFDREMSLTFQPIVDASLGATVGFEALARWNSPELGRVPPDLFIRAAERAGLIGRLTQALFAQALAAAAAWPASLRVSFNLSALDLASAPTIAGLGRILAASGVAAGRIDFEITESALMRDFDQAQESLAVLRGLGCRISLDDFGTGFSSLSYIHRLKFDKLKIDRSFVADIHRNRMSCAVVKTVLDLCRNLELDCIIEGVETVEQRRQLLNLGGRFMQGFLFSRPLEAGAVMDDLRAREPFSAAGLQALRGRPAPAERALLPFPEGCGEGWAAAASR